MNPASRRAARIGTASIGATGAVLAAMLLAPAAGAAAIRPAVTAATAAAHKAQPAVTPGSRYLALGDSVPFGYREDNAIPPPNYHHASNFVGFPEDVASNLDLRVTNAACPGETTASFINTSAQSNGCENSFTKGAKHPTPIGYRRIYPLHVHYTGLGESQLTYAEKFLKKHPHTALVTLMIGANDGFICLERTSDSCFSEFAALQQKITKNVTRILKGIRDKAHYQGQLVLVTYWSLNYHNTTDNYESQGLNSAVEKAGKNFHVRIANGYKQFRLASAQGHGDPCAAGLLTALSGADKGTCGVHPSVAGAAVLAQAVEQAVKK
ncbi:MAG TPA: SGNH/GDSL hydrolase family protein [Mycobacteriales bacterium]|nr:SGNH/GDSL hydrolase family protein [Mycobacteriales bacterium]